MVNNVVLIGRLTKDIELRMTTSGNSVVSFTLAVSRDFVKDGQQDTDFIQCQAWNKTAELMNEYLHKGSLIAVQGRLSVREYKDQNGNKKWSTEVVVNNVQFLESKNSQQSQQQVDKQQKPQYSGSLTQSAEVGSWEEADIKSDDLPF